MTRAGPLPEKRGQRTWRLPAVLVGVWLPLVLPIYSFAQSILNEPSDEGFAWAAIIFGPIVLAGAAIWLGGLVILLIWLLVAALSGTPPARVVAALAGGALLFVTGGLVLAIANTGSHPGPASSYVVAEWEDAPPAGEIWFGSVYNPDTHALADCPGAPSRYGCIAGVGRQDVVILVAHFPYAVHGTVHVLWGASAPLNEVTAQADGEFLELDSFGPFTDAGCNEITVERDLHVLARGRMSVGSAPGCPAAEDEWAQESLAATAGRYLSGPNATSDPAGHQQVTVHAFDAGVSDGFTIRTGGESTAAFTIDYTIDVGNDAGCAFTLALVPSGNGPAIHSTTTTLSSGDEGAGRVTWKIGPGQYVLLEDETPGVRGLCHRGFAATITAQN